MSGQQPAAGWYRRPEDGTLAWWDGATWVAAAPVAPAQPNPPAGWYPLGDGIAERWWDGGRWTEQVRPVAGPASTAAPVPAVGRPTQVVHLERIRWAGIAWGQGGAELSVGFGVLFALLALPLVLFAFSNRHWQIGALMGLMALVLFFGAAVFFVNAHFCRVLRARQQTPQQPTGR